jgi:general secretion pathway protein L
MKAITAVTGIFFQWIDAVTAVAVTWLDRLKSPPINQIRENESGQFLLAGGQLANSTPIPLGDLLNESRGISALPSSTAASLSGSRIELILRPDRFLFRPLELPKRAGEFLDGIVRAQIDRLTPWTGAEAAFGWSKPVEHSADRIEITVAATSLTRLMPFVRALADLGSHSVAVFTLLPATGTDGIPIKVFEERARRTLDVGQIRRALVAVLAIACIAAATTVGASAVLETLVDRQQNELTRRIASVRAAATARYVTADSMSEAQRTLARRKHDSPSGFILLETLSQTLPDHTYVTELRIENNKLRLIGFTRDAPSLIGLIEQSPLLKRATFFAPTTRAPSGAGERFHIEALIQPLVWPRP